MKKKSKKSRLAYIRWEYGMRLQEEKDKKFKDKFGDVKEQEKELELEELKYLEDELLIREPTNFLSRFGE